MIKTAKLYIHKKKRLKKSIFGSVLKPRLSIFCSHKYVYAQIIDDVIGNTLVSSSTNFFCKSCLKKKIIGTPSCLAFLAGKLLAEKALAKNITSVAFDRNLKHYTGRIALFADGARAGGLSF